MGLQMRCITTGLLAQDCDHCKRAIAGDCTCGHDGLGPEWHATGCPQGAATDRELLAHAIWTTGRTRAVDRFPLADAFMPLVEAIARRRAAEELRAAAEALTGAAYDAWARPDWLRDRADALTDPEETL